MSRLIDQSQIDVNTFAGTLEYMSPEVRDYDDYSYNTDCWSLGCVLYELITLDKFYDLEIKANDAIQKELGRLDTLIIFKQLLKMMLQVNKKDRVESDRLKLECDNYI